MSISEMPIISEQNESLCNKFHMIFVQIQRLQALNTNLKLSEEVL